MVDAMGRDKPWPWVSVELHHWVRLPTPVKQTQQMRNRAQLSLKVTHPISTTYCILPNHIFKVPSFEQCSLICFLISWPCNKDVVFAAVKKLPLYIILAARQCFVWLQVHCVVECKMICNAPNPRVSTSCEYLRIIWVKWFRPSQNMWSTLYGSISPLVPM